MVLLSKAMSIYFEVNPSKFLPVTGSKIKIDECTLCPWEARWPND